MPSSVLAGTGPVEFGLQYASIVLVWYDWFLMLPMEVKYIWGSKIRISTIVYILCHYALLANVLYVLAISNIHNERSRQVSVLGSHPLLMSMLHSCDTWYKVIGALSVLGRTAIIFSFTARTYAVWGRRRIVIIYLGTLGFICIALDISHIPGLKCIGASPLPIGTYMQVFMNEVFSILVVVFEFSSATLTFVRCIQTLKERNKSPNNEARRRGFWHITFEQGILYFSFMSVFTIGAVVLNFCAPPGFYQRALNSFTLPLSGLLTSRFILHLRKCEDDLSVLGQLTVASANAAADDGILSIVVDQGFGWDPLEVDTTANPDLRRQEREDSIASPTSSTDSCILSTIIDDEDFEWGTVLTVPREEDYPVAAPSSSIHRTV
ncbi:hypothetical protein BDP27DRAFT_1412870 [Rhodocollybia butyracea]|uniref:DUF6533 domain-containing protein n=1 Tax=Rhodocollybia butyracea TaxID=206335 RepID=A0A9P5Q3Y0_9AGAR|nr:hypothetical protein BDP27DRAFT_1412870 [Rhodocollybia butyracea]